MASRSYNSMPLSVPTMMPSIVSMPPVTDPYGCMDPLAKNYNSHAIYATATCEYEARTPPQEWRSLAPPRALTPPAAQMGP